MVESASSLSVDILLKARIPRPNSKVTIKFDRNYSRRLLVLDIEGPSREGVTYLPYSTFTGLTKLAQKRYIKTHNLVLLAPRLADLVRKYPKLISRNKVYSLKSQTLTQTDLDDFISTALFHIKTNQFKGLLGKSNQSQSVIARRLELIKANLQNESYELTRPPRVKSTQGTPYIL